MNHLDTLMYWIEERERIRERKDAGKPQPWTDDPILREYRFCNVHREDDKVTKWIANNWRNKSPDYNLPFAMCVARLVNWPDTLAELGFPDPWWRPEHFINTLAARKARGEKVWTGAYMVTGGFSEGGESKEVIIARVLDRAVIPCDRIRALRGKGRLSDIDDILSDVSGMGTFLRAQVIADLKYTALAWDAEDWHSWCAPGPGSTKGLNLVMGRPVMTSVPADQFRKEVNWVRGQIEKSTGVQLCAQDTQNCLCELSKYVRAQEGGRLKTRYVPSA